MRKPSGLSDEDREARSQLRQLLDQADGLVHGSLIHMARRCGNPRCRCATKDQKHESWYLGQTQKRKTRMKHIPKDKEAVVRRWGNAYEKARLLLDRISEEAWKHLNSSKV